MRAVALPPAAVSLRDQFWVRLGQAPARVVSAVHEWRQRSRDRADLARLDDRMLADIGVTRAEVWLEINKPFWRE